MSQDVDEIEEAYRRALQAVEEAEAEVGHAFAELQEPDEEAGPAGQAVPVDETALEAAAARQPVAETSLSGPGVTPLQIVEAALFVGGTSLTTKALCRLLNDEFDADHVERLIDELNDRYTAQRRPYEVRFGEGGYRLALHDAFEPVRLRVFGKGPRDVKLSQDVLEILALVAYRQPITRTEVDELAQRNAAGPLRTLVRRELVEVERDPETPKTVRYRTTDRFLELFGLSTPDELPRPEDLEFK